MDHHPKPQTAYCDCICQLLSVQRLPCLLDSTTAVKDPVCGMDVETATAAGRTEHKGQTYYFCGSKCKGINDLP